MAFDLVLIVVSDVIEANNSAINKNNEGYLEETGQSLGALQNKITLGGPFVAFNVYGVTVVGNNSNLQLCMSKIMPFLSHNTVCFCTTRWRPCLISFQVRVLKFFPRPI